MSFTKIWAPHFQSGIRMRGRAYQAAGRVKRLEPQDGELVRAQVLGKRPYIVVIRGQGSTASAECNCPFFAGGSYCKHIWATILDVQYNPLDTGKGGADGEHEQSSVRPPKARRRGAGEKNQPQGEPEWVGRLSLLRVPVAHQEFIGAPAPAYGQVCYCVGAELSTKHSRLAVMLRHREPTTTGWSRLKRLKASALHIAEMPDPIDRELCALILNGAAVEADEASLRVGDPMHDAFLVPTGAAGAMLRRMIQTGRCFLDVEGAEPQGPLIWSGPEPWVLWMVGAIEGDSLVITTQLRRGEERMPIDRPRLILGGVDGLLIGDAQAASFDDCGAARWVSQFRDDWRYGGRATPIRVPSADVSRFLDRLYRLPQLPEIELPTGIGRGEQRMTPTPHLEIFSPDARDPVVGLPTPRSQLVARLSFAYGKHRVRPGQGGRYVQEKPVAKPQEADHDVEADAAQPALIRRDGTHEQEAIALLAALGFRHHPNNGAETLLLAARQMPPAVAALLQRGWVVTADQRAMRGARPPRLSITSGVDWFELHGDIRFETATGEQVISLPEVLAALQGGRKMIRLDDGSEGLLPEEWLDRQGLLAAMGKAHGDHIRFKPTQAALLDAMLDKQDLAYVDERFDAARRRLHEFEGIRPVEPAPTFNGTLRAYQCEGLGWFEFLRWFGMGGVLADDMGLGKTIQVLAMLDARYNAPERETASVEPPAQAPSPEPPAVPKPQTPDPRPQTHRPTLIVVPRSVIFNWIDEAQHFAPRLRVQAYTGADRDALRQAFRDHDVIVTSYGLMRRDIAELRKHPFDYIVLDEAQAIKNPASQSAKAARLLESNHRLALSGTPLENHIGDLWSIFEFLNPDMLGSSTRFGQLIRGEAPAAAEEPAPGTPGAPGAPASPPDARQVLDPHAAARIAKALRPFILRRTKRQVLSELPEKTEQTILCQLEPEQRRLYEQLRTHYRGALLNKLDAAPGTAHALGGANGSGSTMMVLEALLRLRQAACHPGLIDAKRADEPAAKLDVLLDRLTDLIEEGHKALVFSQFTSMLALVRRRLDERGIIYEYLDGQTRHRKKHVQRFQSDPACPLFLISLKAGGLGLNLTAAEYVFILDPWWNPAVEAQAIDRTHRIGQTRHVFAYRLICEDTVEQRIAQLQEKKKKLADAIVGGQESVLASLTREDLDQLLS